MRVSELDKFVRAYPDQVEAVNYIFRRWRPEEKSDNATDVRLAEAIGLNNSTIWSIRKGKRRGGLSDANRVRLNRVVASEGRQSVIQTQSFYRKQRYSRRLEIRGWVTEDDVQTVIEQLQRDTAKEINAQIDDPKEWISSEEVYASHGISDGSGGDIHYHSEHEIKRDDTAEEWWEDPGLDFDNEDFPWDTP